MSRVVVLALLAALVAGCGSTARSSGTATLWVTRDRGAHVLLVRPVPAGQSAMRALEGAARVETRYGGRFVQSIDGLSGSLGARRDWFWYVNGIEGDRSAAEYRLHAGDVEWWDYRSWARSASVPVVVGAFPEPLVHGYGGKRRPTVVVGAGAAARALARRLHARVGPPLPGANVVEVLRRPVVFRAERRGDGSVRFVVSARDALRLARRPAIARFRYEGLP